MSDFRAMSWDEANEYARQQPIEDAEFTVEYDDGKSGPAWDVWALTYPHREREARARLTHTATVNQAYWYQDGDGKVYGMPDINLVRAENERLIEREHRADLRLARVRRYMMSLGMVFGLVLFVGIPLIPDVAPWLLVGIPLTLPVLYKISKRRPKERYRKLAPDARFDIFETDEEIRARRQRLIANVLTIGITALLLWLFSRD